MGDDLSGTAHNKAAGEYLERARRSVNRRRSDFAAELTRELGLEIKPPRYASYEDGRRPVPAALVWAAFRLTGLPVADHQAEQTLGDRLQRLEVTLEGIERELLKLREARLLAIVEPRPASP